MPNWCENNLTISGKKSDIHSFFGKVGFDSSKTDLQNFLNTTDLTLRSWFPMPQTFVDFDTTNPKLKRDARDFNTLVKNESGEEVHPMLFKSDEEYEKYSNGYDNAVEYQKSTYDCVGWFDYNLKTIGVKWAAKLNKYSVNVIEDNDNIRVEFCFETAWNSPTIWLEKLITDFPKLAFLIDGYEPMMGFHTHMYGENGEVLEEYDEDYECDEDDEEE